MAESKGVREIEREEGREWDEMWQKVREREREGDRERDNISKSIKLNWVKMKSLSCNKLVYLIQTNNFFLAQFLRVRWSTQVLPPFLQRLDYCGNVFRNQTH